jgi:hypothetical protein
MTGSEEVTPDVSPSGSVVAESEPPVCGDDPRRGLRDSSREELEELDDEAPADESALDPAAPPEPVVSANASGMAAAAEPMPKATASAPTRPT